MHRTRFCHWLLIFYGATEILLFSGLVFGWGSLVYVLKQEGYMSDVCSNNDDNHRNNNNNIIDDNSNSVNNNLTLNRASAKHVVNNPSANVGRLKAAESMEAAGKPQAEDLKDKSTFKR